MDIYENGSLQTRKRNVNSMQKGGEKHLKKVWNDLLYKNTKHEKEWHEKYEDYQNKYSIDFLPGDTFSIGYCTEDQWKVRASCSSCAEFET